MDLAAALLFFGSLFWVTMYILQRWLKDIPLGPVGLRTKSEDLPQVEAKMIASQNRLFMFWRSLRWLALAMFITATILAIIIN